MEVLKILGQGFTTKTDNGYAVGSFYVYQVLTYSKMGTKLLPINHQWAHPFKPNGFSGRFQVSRYQWWWQDRWQKTEFCGFLSTQGILLDSMENFHIQHLTWVLTSTEILAIKVYNGKKALRLELLDWIMLKKMWLSVVGIRFPEFKMNRLQCRLPSCFNLLRRIRRFCPFK